MARIDNPTIPDPFAPLLARLAGAIGEDERRRLLGELVAAEAEELAWSYCHLTVAHGDPTNVAGARHLTAFYKTVRGLAEGLEWVRVRGTADFVTITVRGREAEAQLAAFVDAAEQANPGDWTLVHAPYPPSVF